MMIIVYSNYNRGSLRHSTLVQTHSVAEQGVVQVGSCTEETPRSRRNHQEPAVLTRATHEAWAGPGHNHPHMYKGSPWGAWWPEVQWPMRVGNQGGTFWVLVYAWGPAGRVLSLPLQQVIVTHSRGDPVTASTRQKAMSSAFPAASPATGTNTDTQMELPRDLHPDTRLQGEPELSVRVWWQQWVHMCEVHPGGTSQHGSAYGETRVQTAQGANW